MEKIKSRAERRKTGNRKEKKERRTKKRSLLTVRRPSIIGKEKFAARPGVVRNIAVKNRGLIEIEREPLLKERTTHSYIRACILRMQVAVQFLF